MADTIPNITVGSTSWIDVYDATGIAVGTSVLITNNSEPYLLIQEQAASPSASNNDGKLMGNIFRGGHQATVTNTPNGLWLKATKTACSVNIQAI